MMLVSALTVESLTPFFSCDMSFLSLIPTVIVLFSSLRVGSCSIWVLSSGWVEWDGVRTVQQGGKGIKDVVIQNKSTSCRALRGRSEFWFPSWSWCCIIFINSILLGFKKWKKKKDSVCLQCSIWAEIHSLNILWRSQIVKGTRTTAQMSLFSYNCLFTGDGRRNKWDLQGQTEEEAQLAPNTVAGKTIQPKLTTNQLWSAACFFSPCS